MDANEKNWPRIKGPFASIGVHSRFNSLILHLIATRGGLTGIPLLRILLPFYTACHRRASLYP